MSNYEFLFATGTQGCINMRDLIEYLAAGFPAPPFNNSIAAINTKSALGKRIFAAAASVNFQGAR